MRGKRLPAKENGPSLWTGAVELDFPMARLSKDNAAPSIGMPAVANSANDRRRYDCRCHHNRRPRYDHDRASIRLTSALWPTVKAGATSALGTRAVDADE